MKIKGQAKYRRWTDMAFATQRIDSTKMAPASVLVTGGAAQKASIMVVVVVGSVVEGVQVAEALQN